jgi:hypothetical protein
MKPSHLLAAVGVGALVFGGGVAVGAGGGTTAATGKPAQVQLFTIPLTQGSYVPAPQPDLTPLPIIQASVTIGQMAHAVVSMDVTPFVQVDLLCTVSPGPPPTQVHGDLVVMVDGVVVQNLGVPYTYLSLMWTPPIGPGTHTVSWSLVCPQGSGNDPGDDYRVNGPDPQATTAPVRVELIKVP